MNLFLVGMAGSGKTTVGRRVAKALSYWFFDSDQVIEKRAGVDIAWIFDMEGEEGFRRRESAVIEELTAMDQIVLATGGGAVLEENNRRYLRKRGMVAYLDTPISDLMLRLSGRKHRPLFLDTDMQATLEKMVEIRTPLYHEVAHHCFSTKMDMPNLVAKQVTDWFLGHQA